METSFVTTRNSQEMYRDGIVTNGRIDQELGLPKRPSSKSSSDGSHISMDEIQLEKITPPKSKPRRKYPPGFSYNVSPDQLIKLSQERILSQNSSFETTPRGNYNSPSNQRKFTPTHLDYSLLPSDDNRLINEVNLKSQRNHTPPYSDHSYDGSSTDDSHVASQSGSEKSNKIRQIITPPHSEHRITPPHSEHRITPPHSDHSRSESGISNSSLTDLSLEKKSTPQSKSGHKNQKSLNNLRQLIENLAASAWDQTKGMERDQHSPKVRSLTPDDPLSASVTQYHPKSRSRLDGIKISPKVSMEEIAVQAEESRLPKIDDDIRQSTERLSVRTQGTQSSLSYSTYSSNPSESEAELNDFHLKTNMEVPLPEEFLSIDRYNKLPELDQVPWSDRDVLKVLQNGRTKDLVGSISVDVVPRVSYLLQRPLIRISKEAQRLSCQFCKCSKQEIYTSMKAILSFSLAESCLKACLRASAMYAMSRDQLKQSKSARAGLHFSVGKFHSWMCSSQVAARVHEYAVIYLTACIENLLEEIILQCTLATEGAMLTLEALDNSITNNVELWGLLQPYEHLVCGRTAAGECILSLPASFNIINNRSNEYVKNKNKKYDTKGNKVNGIIVKNLEQSLLATCVGSVAELGDLIGRAMQHQYSKPPNSAPSWNKQLLSWGEGALNTLFYFMKCTQLEHADNPVVNPPAIHLTYERPYLVLPPLLEWLRVATAHTEHRQSLLVDSDDVCQAARILLPGVDCPPRKVGSEDWLCAWRHLDAQACASRFQEDLAFRMLTCGRTDLVPMALSLIGPAKVNSLNEQGLTPLMLVSIRGDEAMVQILLDAGADMEVQVPANNVQFPSVNTETQHWTSLTFASAHGHLAVAQLLLERGASVEGGVTSGEDCCTETPLQLASAAGNLEMVGLLLAKGADPFLSTLQRDRMTFNAASQRGSYHAVALAAAHGHRNVLYKLLTQPRICKDNEVLSLEEILAEGTTQTLKGGNKSNIVLPNGAVKTADASSPDKPLQLSKFTKQQMKALQEALYHSAENGYLDIAMELRNSGVPWSLHCWTQALSSAQELHRKPLIQCLLKDFSLVQPDDYNLEFVEGCLPLLFDIFRHTKNENTLLQLAEIFQNCYGSIPINEIPEIKQISATRIDPTYVNNPDMSDVQFLVEGRLFYAHKIILVNASTRFKAMLSNKFSEGSQPCVEINDVKYEIFQLIMQYLYNGGNENLLVDQHDVLELMASANFFILDGLQRHCEVLCSHMLNSENALSIYRCAKLYNTTELLKYCEAFFLQNMVTLLKENDGLRRLLHGSSAQCRDLINGLLNTLTCRLQIRGNPSRK